MGRKVRYLVLTGGFFYVIAVANDRLAMYALAWLLISLLLVAFAVARLNAHGLAARRLAVPRRLTAGQPLPGALELVNLGSMPKSQLLLTDAWRYEGAPETDSRTVLVGGLAGESGLRYETEGPAARRGVAVLGPLAVTAGDPLGLFEVTRDLDGTRAEILVHPRLVSLGGALPRGLLGADEGHAGRAASGLELHSLRPYVLGDDLRHVHWPASAHGGQLLVKEYERPASGEALVLLDLDRRQIFGRSAGSSLETAVTAAASLLRLLTDLGHPARLAAWEDGPLDWHLTAGSRLPIELLDGLARIRGAGTVSAAELLRRQRERLGGRVSLALLTAGPTPELLEELRALAQAGRGVWLILLSAAAFGAGATPEGLLTPAQVAARLAGGPRLTVLTPGDDLAAALAAGGEGAP
jgi:uncharacterized protein (DUF58 family)